jgi:membrane-associated protease RseP (regulator of RpoE activity)
MTTEVRAPEPAPAPPPEPVPAQVAQPAPEPKTQKTPSGEGWFSRAWHVGIFAAVVVVVAGVFFTIGWFTSTRGDFDHPGRVNGMHQRMMPQRDGTQGGTDQQPQWGNPQSPNQGQRNPDRSPGMGVPQLQNSGYLGVGLETVTAELQKQYGLSRSSGALVVVVDPDGPADKAGIRQGDVITSIGGTTVNGMTDVVGFIAKSSPGDSVSVTVDRDGQTLTYQVILAQRPASVPSTAPIPG